MIISAPKDKSEFVALLSTAVGHRKGPFMIRYPRGSCNDFGKKAPSRIPIGTWEIPHPGKKIAVLAVGSMVAEMEKALPVLRKSRLDPVLVNARFVKPLDEKMLRRLAQKVTTFVTVEENTVLGGFGSAVMEFCSKNNLPVKVSCIGLPDEFVEHGSREQLLALAGLSAEKIAQRILNIR
jgi:1-deoxy-D-xylulose-5-phosphate synthase